MLRRFGRRSALARSTRPLNVRASMTARRTATPRAVVSSVTTTQRRTVVAESLLSKLSAPWLARDESFIGGEWVAGTEKPIEVDNPATGEIIASIKSVGVAETELAIARAAEAQREWATVSSRQRYLLLKDLHASMLEHQKDLALILTAEQGKSLAEAQGEVVYGASFVEYYAEEAKRVYGDVIPATTADRRIIVVRQPVGVCASITPFNFPNSMMMRKMAPALAVGCSMVAKPALNTPLSALAVGAICEKVGVPKGLFSVVVGPDQLVGSTLTGSPTVRKFSFTGSSPVGRMLAEQCAGTFKRVSLELGGNAPFIVFDDANLDVTIQGAIASKFRNSGQTCVCANRFFVQEGILDRFVASLGEAMKKELICGDGQMPGVTQGPLINEAAMSKVERLVEDAVSKGAKVAMGGERLVDATKRVDGGSSLCYAPTILTGVTPDMQIAHEEIFGPIIAVQSFATESDLFSTVNNSEHGLAGFFFTQDVSRVWRVAEKLEVGMVGVNSGMISTEVAPFGGIKQSGLGREGGKEGLHEYVQSKYINFNIES